MHACARNLACGEEPWNGCSSIQICSNPAHDVVCCGPDRNPIACQVQPRTAARLRDQRETLMHEIGIEPLQRQIHRLAGAAAFANDGA